MRDSHCLEELTVQSPLSCSELCAGRHLCLCGVPIQLTAESGSSTGPAPEVHRALPGHKRFPEQIQLQDWDLILYVTQLHINYIQMFPFNENMFSEACILSIKPLSKCQCCATGIWKRRQICMEIFWHILVLLRFYRQLEKSLLLCTCNLSYFLHIFVVNIHFQGTFLSFQIS